MASKTVDFALWAVASLCIMKVNAAPAPVFLLTDFGLDDHYVAVMKAVILARAPRAQMVDITHNVPPQAVAAGAYLLEAAWPWLPAGAVVCAVVDPGVGTAREAAVFHHEGRTLIGPNNGLFSFLPEGAEGRLLENQAHWLQPVSATFHGRDIFAPCAAYVAAGGDWRDLGTTPANPASLPGAVDAGGDSARRHIIHFDHFGNAITSLPAAAAGESWTALEVPGKLRCPRQGTYGQAAAGAPLAYVGSSGRVEIAIAGGNAQKQLGLALGDVVHTLTESEPPQ